MNRTSEAQVLRDALGWALLLGGGAWIALRVWFAPDGGSVLGDSSDGFLAGVLTRSFDSLYQGALLAGLASVPVHALWTVLARRNAAEAYDAYALWAQTLFTSLGFLGTIVGISLAVAGLEAAMSEGEPGALVNGLSTAFDTTFLGLAAALMLMIFRKLARLKHPGRA